MELHPPIHFGVVAIEKEAFGSPSTKVANFTTVWLQVILSFTNSFQTDSERCPRGSETNVLEDEILGSKFELQPRFYIHLGKVYSFLSPPHLLVK